MRVFIITLDEPVYAPVYLSKIIERIQHSIEGITALSPSGKNGWFNLAQQRFDMYGMVDFVKAGSIYSYSRLMSYWPFRRPGDRFYSIKQLASHHSISLYPCTNVNDRDYIQILHKLEIDILLSVAANQRFKQALLDVPRLACLNVHSALLPEYRGLDGLFWALTNGETEVGVTVHIMTEGFDEGEIVAQQPFRVSPGDSLHTIYYQAMDIGSILISQVLDQYELGTVITRVNDISKGSYFSWPNREAARRFRDNGWRFF